MNNYARIPKIQRTEPPPPPPSNTSDIEERDKLRTILINLQGLLEKTSKKGGELLRSYRGRDLNSNPSYIENLRLQKDVEKRIEEVKCSLFEISKRINANKEVTNNSENLNELVDTSSKPFPDPPVCDEDEINDKNFVDRGVHWCKQCDLFSYDLATHLKHLTSDSHWKMSKSKEEPWRRTDIKTKLEVDPANKKDEDMKGVHKLIAIRGYFCSVCGVLLGSPGHAEDHLKTNMHNRNYIRFNLMNGQHERNYSIDKSRALKQFKNAEKKRKKGEQEEELKEKEAKRKALEENIKKKLAKAKAEAEKNKLIKNKAPEKDQDQDPQRNREKDRDRDRDRDRDKDRRHKANGKIRFKSEIQNATTTIIEKIDEPAHGPHWPFNDAKLSMKAMVVIPMDEWNRCYRKRLKMIVKKPTIKKPDDQLNSFDPMDSINPLGPMLNPMDPLDENSNDEMVKIDSTNLLNQIDGIEESMEITNPLDHIDQTNDFIIETDVMDMFKSPIRTQDEFEIKMDIDHGCLE